MYGKSVLLYRVARSNVRYYKGNSTKKLLEFLADMPKANTQRITESQRQRQQIAKKSEKYGPSSVYLQVLGSGARGVPNTLYMFTDQKRYLFNCGEQTQRLAHEHKVKLSRLDHIFITSKTWRNVGGLPGLSLTLQDVGVPSITLHGPEGLDELYSATRRFVIMKEMKVTMAKCSPNEDFEDSVMNVKYVVLGPDDESILVKDAKPAAKRPRISENLDKNYEEFMHDNTDYYRRTEAGGEALAARKQARDRKSPSPKMTANDPMKKRTDKVLNDLQKMSHCTVSYICTLKKRLGTLDLAKCVERGVKPGPLLGQLKAGHDVVLPDGTLVLSKDVKTPDDPGPVFIVLDVPDISYLKEHEFSSHFANGTNPQENIPELIVHYTPPEVFHDAAYQKFISQFGPTPRHLILNGQNSCLGSEAVHRTQHKLHLLDPDIFPLLKDVSVPAVWSAHPPLVKTASPVRLKGMEELKNKIALAQFQSIINMEGSREHRPLTEAEKEIEIIAGRTLTMFHLRPKKQLDRSAEPKLHIQDYIQETMDVDGFVGSLEQFRRLVDNLRYAKRVSSKEYPKVVFLGTGSCIPSKTRNTSSIVLHVDETRSILLDCGEGTFGQLVRFYGPKRVNSFLRTLRAIYVSHLHADHHIGLIGILQARRQAFDEISPLDQLEPVHILAPGQIVSWLTLYDQHFERIQSEFTLLPNQALLMDKEPNSTSPEITSAVLAKLGVSSITTCIVPHCPNAFGVAIHIGPHKITYSGDTLPCETLIKLGQDSTLLIHEATMEDELADEARMKMHSTTTQAIDIGRKMNAKYTVLTHFSQRYARLPRLNENILNDNSNVGIAFDNMQITISDLELLPHMYAPLQLMFAEHCVEMELKAAHRAQRKKLRQMKQDLEIKGRRTITTPSRNNSATEQRRMSRDTLSITSGQQKQGSPSPVTRTSSPTCRATLKNKMRSCSKSPESRSSLDHRNSVPTPKCGDSGGSSPAPKQPLDEAGVLAEHPLSGTETISINRTISLSSSVNNDTSSCDTHIIDSRPKNINTTVLPVAAAGRTRSQNAEINHITRKRNSTQIFTPSKKTDVTSSSESKGYGKPLVTPVTKRLTIRKDIQLTKTTVTQNTPSSKSPSPVRSRPPTPQKGTLTGDVDRNNVKTVTKVKTPNKPVSSGKCRGANSDVNKNAPRNPVTVRGTSSSQNNPTQPRFGTAKINSIETTKPRWRDAGPPSVTSRHTPKPVQKDNENKIDLSVTRTNSRRSSSVSLGRANTIYSESGSPTRPCTPRKTISTCSSRDLEDSEVSKLLQNVETRFNEPAAHQSRRGPLFDKDRKFPYHRVNNALHNSKYFKPQLEDIKSSFLLLNKKQQNWRNIENVEPPKKEIRSIAYARKRKYSEEKRVDSPQRQTSSLLLTAIYCCCKNKTIQEHIETLADFLRVSKAKAPVEVKKPKPISEEERRQKLIEIKQSFKTKQFFHDSKYDKIEGLNWITWK